MRLGIGSYALPWNVSELGYFGLIETAVSLGVDAVQYADNLPLEALPSSELDRLIALAREHRIVVEPGTRGLDIPRLTFLIELASRCGCGFVRLVMAGSEGEPTVEEAFERLRPLATALRHHGVRLAIENHDRLPARDLAQFVEALGRDAFSVCLDTANSLGCLEGIEHVVRVLGPLAVNLHMKDVRVDRLVHGLGFVVTGTAAGEGALDVAWVLGRLAHIESVTIESWPNPTLAGNPSLTAEREMLARSVAYLRPLVVP